jgi:lipopolysaccharide export system permease protein
MLRLRVLDRYVLRQFLRIFALCVLGVPFILIVIDLTDHLSSFLNEGATRLDVLLHYVYQFPYQSLLAFPIAALLAAVFTISSMTRHFETTAAKAGGVSFYRLTVPLLLAGGAISLVALALTEVVPAANRKADEVLGKERTRSETVRNQFVYRGNAGAVYQIRQLDAHRGSIAGLEITREGTGWDYPSYDLLARGADWDSAKGRWTIQSGSLRLFPERGTTLTFDFNSVRQRSFRETPQDLLAEPKDPEEMGYAELGRFIEAIERSGGTARELIVQRALKIAFPITCLIIVIFGLPLAHSTRRGGAPVAMGIALATTIFFLMLIRITQALGAGGVLPPVLAAWLPNFLFLAAGLALMARVQT